MPSAPVAPVLVGQTDEAPCPRVEVSWTALPSGTDSITVTRSWQGQSAVVRGARRVPATTGGFLVTDYEAPLGVPVSYSAVVADAAGVDSPAGASTTTTLDVAGAWLQDPLSPSLSMPISLFSSGADAWLTSASLTSGRYDLPGSTEVAVGSADRVGLAGVRLAAGGLPIVVHTIDLPTSGRLSDIVRTAAPYLLRTPTRARILPRLAYVLARSLQEIPLDGDMDRTTWDLSGDLVAPPGAGVVVPVHTWAEVKSLYSTWGDLKAAKATWMDVKRNPAP